MAERVADAAEVGAVLAAALARYEELQDRPGVCRGIARDLVVELYENSMTVVTVEG